MKRQQSEKHLLENGEVIVDPDNDEIVTIKIKVIETKQRGNAAICVTTCVKDTSSGLEGLFNFQVHEAEEL